MAICRVYLCTYRRNQLLKRALASLISQTSKDWICELHNDDPNDPFPGQLVAQLSDPRISIINHKENLGPTRTFNLLYTAIEEPYLSLLEDDNTWEPNFLVTMIDAMERHPEVNIAWANMRMLEEQHDGSWLDTKRTIWPTTAQNDEQLFYWPHERQILGALHSNGAMLVRTTYAHKYRIPDSTPFVGVEHVRERTFLYPIMLVSQVLANFSITKETARSKDLGNWTQLQILLAGSYFKYVPLSKMDINNIWQKMAMGPIRTTNTLILTALIYPGCRKLLKHISIKDLMLFLASALKRPGVIIKALNTLSDYADLWLFLEQHTAQKVREMQELNLKNSISKW